VPDKVTWEQAHRVREWLLAVLRFAVTLEPADRAAVLAIAEQMDRLGFPANQPSFSFFVRTSTEFCKSIVAAEGAEKRFALSHYLGKIDDDRLRRAFESVLEARQTAGKSPKTRRRQDLWRGLPIR
jgi:hypothetical protein